MSSLRDLDAPSGSAAALEGDSSAGEGNGLPAKLSAAGPRFRLAAAQSSDTSEAGDEDIQEDGSDAEDAASQDSEGGSKPFMLSPYTVHTQGLLGRWVEACFMLNTCTVHTQGSHGT